MNDSPIFQVAAELFRAETKRNKSIRLTFDTQENVSAEALKRVFEWRDQVGWLSFAVRQVDVDDIKDLPEIVTEETRTPSQRMRAVLFRLWETNPEGYTDFNPYYAFKMEKLINFLKEKLA
jgi:hypothetical protein